MAVTKLPGSQIGTVNSTNLGAGSVDSTALATGAVVSGKIGTAAIDSNTLFAAGVVDANALADNSVDAGALQANSVTSGKIAANAVAAGNISANAVTAAKLNTDVAGIGLVLDGSTNALNVSLAPTNPGLTTGTGDQLAVLLDGSTLQKGVNGVSVNQSASFNFSSFTGTLSGAMSANGNKITSLANPSTGTDAANKDYVDSIASGLDPKQSCLVATTGPLTSNTYNNGTSGVGATLTGSANGAIGTIDGVPVAATGLRILVKNEATQANNGIYVVTTVGNAGAPYVLTRAADFNSNVNITPGAFTFIEQGSTQADTGWVLANDGAVTVGTTGLTFVQFSQTAAVNAGNGLTKNGNTISALLNAGATNNIVPAIDISSNGLAIKVDNASIGVDGNNQLAVKANGITSGMIASSAVGSTQLATGAVVTTKITDGNVTAAKLNADVTVQLGALGTMGTAAISTGTETITFAGSATAADKDAALLVFLNGALLTPGASADYTRNVSNNRTTGFTLQRSGTTGACTYFFGG